MDTADARALSSGDHQKGRKVLVPDGLTRTPRIKKAVLWSLILTIYWIAFAVGRGSGIILTRYITSWLFVIIGCVGSIIGVAGIIGTDYLISEEASEAAREASLITNTVIFGFFVSVSFKKV